MKTMLYNGSRKTAVDTRLDECLYRAPRPARRQAGLEHTGKDLFVHTDAEKGRTFYLHLWTLNKKANGKILPLSPVSAEQFLRGKGLVCNLFKKNNAISTLYRWGYGIAEEF